MRWACLLLVCYISQVFSQDHPAATDVISPPDSEVVTIGEITISGNKITRDMIILREVEFKPGDELTVEELKSRVEQARARQEQQR